MNPGSLVRISIFEPIASERSLTPRDIDAIAGLKDIFLELPLSGRGVDVVRYDMIVE